MTMNSINPKFIPKTAFPFQQHLIEWSCRLGRASIFADCGLGKSLMQLAWSQNIVEQENKRVLILSPLAVSAQTVREGEKFGIECEQSRDGKLNGSKIVVTNYEKMHLFNPNDFIGLVCDESGILKNANGATRNAVVAFANKVKFTQLCTATPSPNDYTELGNSVECLKIMRRVEMLAKYFVHDSGDTGNWRLKGHAIQPFWKFVASWARAIRHPRDIGFDQPGYDLPPLDISMTILGSKPTGDFLFPTEAITLDEQRAERRETINERCAEVAKIANAEPSQFVAWCSLNTESQLLTKLIDGAIELTGSDSDEEKEEKILAFSDGKIKAIVTKPKICSHGVNWQNCHRTSFFPSHSHEQYYQAVRRFWRFMQKEKVRVHIVTTEAESRVLDNLKRKERDAENMYREIVRNMAEFYHGEKETYQPTTPICLPKFIKS